MRPQRPSVVAREAGAAFEPPRGWRTSRGRSGVRPSRRRASRARGDGAGVSMLLPSVPAVRELPDVALVEPDLSSQARRFSW